MRRWLIVVEGNPGSNETSLVLDQRFSASLSAAIADEARDYLIRQFDTAWKLTNFHLDGLATEECLWRPAHEGLHVHHVHDGRWRADWPDQEGYDLGPPSIAWLTWHVGFWWSMVLDGT